MGLLCAVLLVSFFFSAKCGEYKERCLIKFNSAKISVSVEGSRKSVAGREREKKRRLRRPGRGGGGGERIKKRMAPD